MRRSRLLTSVGGAALASVISALLVVSPATASTQSRDSDTGSTWAQALLDDGERDLSADDDPGIGLEATVIDSVDGELALTVPVTAEAEFEPPAREGGLSVTYGTLPPFTVKDERHLSRPGFTVHASVSSFESDRTTFDASAVTITPAVLTEGTTTTGVVPAAPFAGSAVGSPFADAPEGSGNGTTTLGGSMRLVAPVEAPADTYRATMTLTIVSR